MLTYILKVTLCWAAFYLVYHLLLRRETFFRLNRYYLLVTVLLGLGLPAFEFNWQLAETPAAVYYLQPITVGVEQLETVIVTASAQEEGFDFWALLTWVYWAGVAITLASFGYGLLQISRLYRQAEMAPGKGYRFVSTHQPHVPFSFFKNLFWSKKFEVSEEDRLSILRHEEAHIFQWHSLDVMLFELAGVFLWCSPFIYLYKNAMKTTHEYLADDYVTADFSKKQYGRLLLRQSQSIPKELLHRKQIAISNSLFSSQLKKRIVMMTKNKSSQWASLKYLAALPVVALLLLAFSFVQAQKEDSQPLKLTTGPANDGLILIEETVQTETLKIQKEATKPEKLTNSRDTVPADEPVFKKVEEMPRFPGCENITDVDEQTKCWQTKMLEFISSNLKYPEAARKNGIEGMSVVKFIVEKDGSITEAETVRAIGGECDEEVIKVVYMMPKWIPGKQGGKTVRTQFMLPVKFKLDGEAPKADKTVEKDVDQMPRFGGCETAENKDACSQEKLIQFIMANLKYPADAKKAGVEGTAVVSFVVGDDGAIQDAKVIKGFSEPCDAEALRVVNAMPNWTPGVKDGKNVAVEMALPFKFALPKMEGEPSVHSSAKLDVFDVYPNPSSENGFYVKYKTEPGKLVIRLTDVNGKHLSETPVVNYDGSEQTTHMASIFEKKAAKSNVVVSLYLDGKHVDSKTVVMH